MEVEYTRENCYPLTNDEPIIQWTNIIQGQYSSGVIVQFFPQKQSA